MKINEFLSEGYKPRNQRGPKKGADEHHEKKPTMADLIARFEKIGGKLYSKIKGPKEADFGWLGVNGKGQKRVFFMFTADGTMKRFERKIEEKDLPRNWKADTYEDPIAVKSAKKEESRIAKEMKFEEDVQLSEKELEKLCRSLGGRIADSWVERRGYKKIGDRYVAYSVFSVHVFNEDHEEFDEEDENAEYDAYTHDEVWPDPVYVKVWRDDKNPDKYHYDDTSLN